MRLIRNTYNESHKTAIESIFCDAKKVMLSVAFLKLSGAQNLQPLFKSCLQKGGSIRAFFGTDFFLTEPEALRIFEPLRKKYAECKVFVAGSDRKTFHPKVYVGLRGKSVKCLIGSANLTNGGMSTNEEISAFIQFNSRDRLFLELMKTFDEFELDERYQELDELVLKRYEANYTRAKKIRKKAEEELRRLDVKPFDLAKLGALFAKYKKSKDYSLVRQRGANRLQALKVQKQIIRLSEKRPLSNKSVRNFEGHLKDLISSRGGRHLWYSGDVHRRGLATLKEPQKMIDLFKLALEASKSTPAKAWEKLTPAAYQIDGVGINMLTEMLATYNPKRFAIFNGNTAGALKAIGIDTPASRTKKTFRPIQYESICNAIGAVRDRIGAADYSEADGFLNFVYFDLKKRSRPRG